MYSKKVIRADMVNDAVSMKGLALTATFTSLVFLSTSLFYIALSSTGFFNLGEVFVFLAALIGGPIVGGISGGLGAAMADMALGYGSFAPATAILKFLEGFIAGFLFKYSKKLNKKYTYSLNTVVSAFLIGFSSFFVNTQIELGFVIHTVAENYITIQIPGYTLLIISIILSVFVWFTTIYWDEKGKMILSCFMGGVVIIIGYFLYELTPIIGLNVATAASEIPFNIAQVVFGTAIAVPLVAYLNKLGAIDNSVMGYQEEKEDISPPK